MATDTLFDAVLDSTPKVEAEHSDGPFALEWDQSKKDGKTYGMMVCRDDSIHWRFKKIHPKVVALILKNPAEAKKMLAAWAKGAPKRKARQGS